MAEATPDRLFVSTPQGTSGVLAREAGTYIFTYAADATAAAEVSLTMPLRAAQYVSTQLHPIFQMNLPEGYVLEQLRLRFAKASAMDPMLLLATTAVEAPIGRLRVHPPGGDSTPLGARADESLDEILGWRGTGELFRALASRYLLRTGASGVQPKLLVPVQAGAPGKLSLTTTELIVKSGGAEYPGLALNEFVCMSIAREAGVPVPEFHLSNDRQLFVMRRFDRASDGSPVGFEDFAVLMGKGAADKYRGSYEQLARYVELFCDGGSRRQALAQLFDQVALSCMLGNGDAHLKNFGVVYEHPRSGEVTLAPAYDLVNTTSYLPEDSLALTLGGSKSFFASRLHLLAFGERCEVDDARGRIRHLLNAAERTLAAERGPLEDAPHVQRAITGSLQPFRQTFG